MKRSIKIITSIWMLFQLTALPHYAQGTDCCSRHATISICSAYDPMGIVGDIDTYCLSVKGTLAEKFTRHDCFHLINPEYVEDMREVAEKEGWSAIMKPASIEPEVEYSFDADFESGLEEYNEEGRPIRSRFEVTLYFEGEQREEVFKWQTQGTWDTVSDGGTTWLGHGQKFSSQVKESPDIIEILERFEKRPVECEVSPDKETVNASEVIDIEVSGFKDLFGESSREFNRIVVHAYSGTIMNGSDCDIGPDYKAFKVDDGSVTVKYKAPGNCDEPEDRITVYSSCDILPEDRVPMSATSIKDRLEEKNLKIFCPDATITVKKTVSRTIHEQYSEDKTEGSCKRHWEEDHDLNERIEVSVTLSLKLEEAQEMPLFNQTWEYYKPMSANVSGFSYNSTEKKNTASDHSGAGCARSGHKTDIDIFRNLETYEIAGAPQSTQSPWILIFDNESGEAVKIIPAGYNIEYRIHEKENLHSIVYSDQGPKEDHQTTNKTRELSFDLGPVGEEIDDPTVKRSDKWIQDYLKRQGVDLPPGVEIPTPSNEEAIQKIPPDILVKSVDGTTSFGGFGDRTIRTELEHGFEEIRLHYNWNMTRRKK
jgi:hypothetical protein